MRFRGMGSGSRLGRSVLRGRLVAVGLGAALVLAACGGGTSGGTTTTTTPSSGSGGSSASTTGPSTSSTAASGGSSGGTISASTLASLKASVAKAEQIPPYTPPGPPVSASVLEGKSALVMAVNSEIDACQTQAKDFAALGQSLGMKVKNFANSGQPSQWVSGAQDAVSGGYNALAMLCGIIPGALAPELQSAHSHGIAVVDGNYNEVTNYKYLDGETAVDTAGAMKDDVDLALVNLGGKPLHALVVSTNSIVQGPAARKAVADEIKRVCSTSCSVVQNIIVPIQDWGTKIQSDVSSAFIAHPDVNAVFVNFDGMTNLVLPALESAHRPGLKIYTWGGGRSVEKLMMSPNSLVAADSGPDEQWDAYEAMDQVIRLLNHKPAAPVTKEVDPNRLWVPSNVSAFFGPGGTYGNKGYGGNAFVNGFRQLWGLKPVS